VGATSNPLTVTLGNVGNVAITVFSIAASGEFAQSNNCGNSVAAGASCTITVTFSPSGAGSRVGAVTIVDDAPGSPQMVPLSGNGQ
jgi:hypothetical protein